MRLLAVDLKSELLRCTCGRVPKLRVGFRLGGFGIPSLYIVNYECSRWFFKCHRAEPCVNDKDYFDLALRHATERWNDLIRRDQGTRR